MFCAPPKPIVLLRSLHQSAERLDPTRGSLELSGSNFTRYNHVSKVIIIVILDMGNEALVLALDIS